MLDKEVVRKLIQTYDDAYYNQNISLISDAEYDMLKKLLNPEDERVAGNALLNRVKHVAPILSLDKVKITEEKLLRDHIKRLWPISIEPKLDGLTLVIYPDGTCLTRGDGEYGEDVSKNIKFKKGALLNLPIRGEVVVTKENFMALNKLREKNGEELFKNPRNCASGILRQKNDAKYLEYLSFIVYDIIAGSHMNNAHIELLKRDGWQTVESYKPETIEQALEYIYNYDKESYICDLDGLVIKHIGHKTYGQTKHHPNDAIAVKFVSEEKWTTLLDIHFQVGRTGKIVPVAEFEPIGLMGSTVTRATLHNIGYIKALGLDKDTFNKEVCVTKANDIIPAIINTRFTENRKPHTDLIIPIICPVCGTPIITIENQQFCPNKSCKEKIIYEAVHLASRKALDIEGLSEETIRKMYNQLDPSIQYDFTFPFLFTKDMILKLEGFADMSATKLYKTIQKARQKVALSKFLVACNIPLLGASKAQLVAVAFDTLEEIEKDLANKAEVLYSIPTVGDELIQNMKTFWYRTKSLSTYITTIVSEKKQNSLKADYKTFVITGTLENPRSYYVDIIEKAGHKVSNSVSKKTYALLAGEEAGSKLKKALDLQLPILRSEKELIDILGRL